MRPDSNRLLIGKEITIHALPPLPNNSNTGSDKVSSSSGGGKAKSSGRK